VFVRSPYLVIHPLAPPHISVRLFKVAARKEINYAVKVRPLAPRDDCNEYRLCVAQARVTDSQQQSAFSQTMSFSKYSISIERITTTSVTLYGNGTYLRMYVKDGDKLYLHHHTVSISKFSAHMELLSGRISASGQPFLSFLIIAIPGDT